MCKSLAGLRPILIAAIVALAFDPQPAVAQERPIEEGYIAVRTPGAFFVLVDHDISGAVHGVSGDTIAVPAGIREITVAPRGGYPHNMRIRVNAGEIQLIGLVRDERKQRQSEFTLYEAIRIGGNRRIHTDDDARVFVDGEYVGEGAMVLNIEPGDYRIDVELPQYGVRRTHRISVDDFALTEHDFHVRPDRRRSSLYAFVPGLAQISNHHVGRGSAIALTFAAGVAGAWYLNEQFSQENVLYEDLRRAYGTANDEETVLRLGNEMAEQYDVTRRFARQRNTVIGVAAGVYLVNVIDALRRPRTGFRDRAPVAVYPVVDAGGPGVGVRVSGH